jgi:hypothetical protein
MKAVRLSETPVKSPLHCTGLRHIPEDSLTRSHGYEEFRYYILDVFKGIRVLSFTKHTEQPTYSKQLKFCKCGMQ